MPTIVHPPPVTHMIGGNTAGTPAVITSGVRTLAGGSNITLSQNGNLVTVNGGSGGPPDFSTLPLDANPDWFNDYLPYLKNSGNLSRRMGIRSFIPSKRYMWVRDDCFFTTVSDSY